MESLSRWLCVLSCFALIFLAGATVEAQPPGDDILFEVAVPPPHGATGITVAADHLKVLSFEEGFETKLVKGAPYQADAVTEIIQTLADGNRIVRKTTALVARDGEGRTRREMSLAAIGALAPAEAPPRTAFISDPLAGTRYLLELDQRVARKLPAESKFIQAEASREGAPADPVQFVNGARLRRMPFRDKAPAGTPPERAVWVHGSAEPGGKIVRKEMPGQTEPLGTQVIEGVEAEGTRTRFVIPAGEIGNERPIEIVGERWYSPELQAVVLSRRSDPRFGETTYRLLNLSRGEPDRTLFEVPADFTVSEAKHGPFRKKLHIMDEDQRPE